MESIQRALLHAEEHSNDTSKIRKRTSCLGWENLYTFQETWREKPSHRVTVCPAALPAWDSAGSGVCPSVQDGVRLGEVAVRGRGKVVGNHIVI